MTSESKLLCNFIHKVPSRTQYKEITEAQKNAISAAFYRYDDGQKGYLLRNEVKVAIVALFGYKPSKFELNQLLGFDEEAEQKTTMSLEVFMEQMSLKMAAQDEDDVIRQTFLTFDSQCRGFLTVEDLKKVLGQVAPHMPAHTVESTFRELDRDGDGRVSYKDFEFMMKYNTDDGF